MNNACPFCNYVDKNGQKVYESEKVYAIISNNPINRYHVLVIPHNHYQNLVDIPENVLRDLIMVVQQLSRVVRKVSKSDAITHITEDEVIGKGYNMVGHFKFHIIPRYKKDVHFMNWQPLRVEVTSAEMKQIASEIRSLT